MTHNRRHVDFLLIDILVSMLGHAVCWVEAWLASYGFLCLGPNGEWQWRVWTELSQGPAHRGRCLGDGRLDKHIQCSITRLSFSPPPILSFILSLRHYSCHYFLLLMWGLLVSLSFSFFSSPLENYTHGLLCRMNLWCDHDALDVRLP